MFVNKASFVIVYFDGKDEIELASFSFCTFHLQVSAKHFYQLLTDRKSKTSAAKLPVSCWIRLREAFKNFRELCFWNPDAGIIDSELHCHYITAGRFEVHG